jgi:hypothetical protein
MKKQLWWQAPLLTLILIFLAWVFYVPGSVLLCFTTGLDICEKGLAFFYNYGFLVIVALVLYVFLLVRVCRRQKTVLFTFVTKRWVRVVLFFIFILVVLYALMSLIPLCFGLLAGIPADMDDHVYYDRSCESDTDCVIIAKDNGCCTCGFEAYHKDVVDARQEWNNIWQRHVCTAMQCEQMKCADEPASRQVRCVEGTCEIFTS